VTRAASLLTFVFGLAIGIVVGLPLIGCAALVGGARFAAVVDRSVRRRIFVDGAAIDEAMTA
jgi:hypothetical protein